MAHGNKKWTDELIEQKLKAVSEELGAMPSDSYLRLTGRGALSGAIQKHGGYRVWAKRLGFHARKSWTSEAIEKALDGHCRKIGRMPSASELRDAGDNELACAISRHGGYSVWAKYMNMDLKASESELGIRIQHREAVRLRKVGHDVAEQTTKGEFDLLVDGHQVDVKASHWSEYPIRGGMMRGWIFHLHKVPPTCDFYLLVCLDEDDSAVRRYLIPASAAHVQTISITKHGKYEPFRDAFDALHKE